MSYLVTPDRDEAVLFGSGKSAPELSFDSHPADLGTRGVGRLGLGLGAGILRFSEARTPADAGSFLHLFQGDREGRGRLFVRLNLSHDRGGGACHPLGLVLLHELRRSIL